MCVALFLLDWIKREAKERDKDINDTEMSLSTLFYQQYITKLLYIILDTQL